MKMSAWLLVSSLVLAAAPAAAGQGVWTPIGGPQRPSGNVLVDPAHPETVYVLVAQERTPESPASLWKSIDGGDTWHSIQEGIGGPVASLVIDPLRTERLYAWQDAEAATDYHSILWVSEDAGASWELRYLQPTAAVSAQLNLLPSPVREGVLFGWTFGSSFDTAVYRSTDGGASWTLRSDVGDLGSILSLSFNPLRNLLEFFNAGGFYVSSDEGLTWSLRGRFGDAGFLTVARSSASPDRLYAKPALPNVCLVRSDNGGATWRKLRPPKLPAHASCTAIAVDPRDPDLVRVVAQDESGRQLMTLLATSRDGGKTWSRPRSLPAIAVVPTPADRDTLFGENLYPFDKTGIYRTTDSGQSWEPVEQGIAAGGLRYGLAAFPGSGQVPTLVGATDEGLLVRSVDGGRSWTHVTLRSVEYLSLVADAGGQVLYARKNTGRVAKSLDRGLTWVDTPITDDQLGILLADPYRAGRLFVSVFDYRTTPSESHIFRTLDIATLTLASTGLPVQCAHIASVDYCPGVLAQTSDPRASERVLLAYGGADFFSVSAPVFVSTDGGTVWHQAAQSPPGAVFSLAPDPATAGAFLAGTHTGAIYRSEDGGEHWSPFGTGLAVESPVRQLLHDDRSGAWYAVTQDNGVFRSTDGGRSWSLTGPGLPDPYFARAILDPEVPDRLLLAVRGQGVWSWSAPARR